MDLALFEGEVPCQVAREDLGRGPLVGALDLDLHVEAAGAEDGRIDQVLPVGRTDHDHVAQRLHTVDLGQQLRDDGGLHVGADARSPGAEQGVHLVEEDYDGDALLRLLPGPLEDQPDLALGLPHVLVEKLGALDVEEVAAGLLVARLLRHLLGQGVGHRLGDQRLAATGRAVEQDALGSGELVLHEQLPVQERQLHGVGDGLDLIVEAAHVVVGDVGDLLEDELLHLGARQALEQHAGAGVHQDGVPCPQLLADELVGQLGHPLLVRPSQDDGPPAVLQDLLQGHDLARHLPAPGQHDVERLVEHHLLAPLEGPGVEFGVQGDPHLAPAGEDVDGGVLVGAQVGPVGRGGLGELLHLFPQGGDVLPGLPEGVGQLLVLGDGLGQLALRLQQLLLQGPDALGRVLQPPAEGYHLLLQDLGLLLELGDFPLVGGQPTLVLRIRRRDHLLPVPPPPLSGTIHRCLQNRCHFERPSWPSVTHFTRLYRVN